jgi:hypothetical protein
MLIYEDNEIIMLNIFYVNVNRLILVVNHKEVEVLFDQVQYEDELLQREEFFVNFRIQ